MFEYLIEFTYFDQDGEIVYGDILYEVENEISDFDKLETDSVQYIIAKYPEAKDSIKVTAIQSVPKNTDGDVL